MIGDCKLSHSSLPISYEISNSTITRVFDKVFFKIDKGNLEVEKLRDSNPKVGDPVRLDHKTAPNGKYKIGLMKYIHVKDGKIIRLSNI